MAIKLPERNYLTFLELQSRWECTENDLRYAIISGELKPSVRIDAELSAPDWEHDFFDGMVASGDFLDGNYESYKFRPRGWQYLQDPFQTAPFDCRFSLISDDRDAEKPKEPDYIPFTLWFYLPKPMNLEGVKSDAVFLLKEIARFEEKHGDNEAPEKHVKPLATRERDTLLTIIAAMARAAKIDVSQPGKAALSIEAITDELGAHVSKRAIEDHLKKIPDALGTRMK